MVEAPYTTASIATGDPLPGLPPWFATWCVVASAVRSLGEKDLLKEASAPLLAEIALAVDVSEDDARDVMTAMILDESRARPWTHWIGPKPSEAITCYVMGR